MSALKAGEVERYLQKPDLSKPLHLFYGPDRGLVGERARKFAKATAVDLQDAFSCIKLDMESLSGDPDRLMNEAYTVSMFGGDRLIWLRGAGNDVSLTKQIERLLAEPPEDTHCLLEAGDLKKGSKLRDLVERSKMAVAIPCYSDGPRDIAALLDSALASSGKTIGLEARQFLLSLLGGDRMASRAEIDKLVIYVGDEREITHNHIISIVGDASAVTIDAITDSLISGNLSDYDRAIAKFVSSGGSSHALFASVIRQFLTLDRMRYEIEYSNKSAAAVIASARPPVFFARKQAVEKALQKWSSAGIRAALERLQTALLDSRMNGTISDEISYMSMLGLTVQAARRR